MDIRAAFFDLDGTLLDSIGMWAEIDRRSLGRRGIAVPEDYQKAVSVMRIHEAARYTVERFGLPEDPQDLEREWMDMARREYAHNVPLKPGAREYLNALRAQGVDPQTDVRVDVASRDGVTGIFGISAEF